MSASNRIQRSLIAFAALLGFSAMANAGPHVAGQLRGVSHGSYRTMPWNGHGISPYSVYRPVDHFAAPYYWQRGRTSWDVGFGIGFYQGNVYGRRGMSRYDFHEHH